MPAALILTLLWLTGLIAMLCATPVSLAASLDINRHSALTLAIALGPMRVNVDGAFMTKPGLGLEMRIARGMRRKKPQSSYQLELSKVMGALRGAARSSGAEMYLIRHIKVDRLTLHMRLGTGDAASTALLCGAAQTLFAALGAALKVDARVTAVPSFQGRELLAAFCGIVSVPLGHVMVTALLFGLRQVKGRAKKWIGIPLKTS